MTEPYEWPEGWVEIESHTDEEGLGVFARASWVGVEEIAVQAALNDMIRMIREMREHLTRPLDAPGVSWSPAVDRRIPADWAGDRYALSIGAQRDPNWPPVTTPRR